MENEITSKVISLAPMSGLQSKEVESIKYLFNDIGEDDDDCLFFDKLIHSVHPFIIDVTVRGKRDRIKMALQELGKYDIFKTGEVFKAKEVFFYILSNKDTLIMYELEALTEFADCFSERFNWWYKPVDMPNDEIRLVVALGGLESGNIGKFNIGAKN